MGSTKVRPVTLEDYMEQTRVDRTATIARDLEDALKVAGEVEWRGDRDALLEEEFEKDLLHQGRGKASYKRR